jgi:hypothetical protein
MRIGELLKESLGKFELDYEAVTYFTADQEEPKHFTTQNRAGH